jgi:hypothetical protein
VRQHLLKELESIHMPLIPRQVQTMVAAWDQALKYFCIHTQLNHLRTCLSWLFIVSQWLAYFAMQTEILLAEFEC